MDEIHSTPQWEVRLATVYDKMGLAEKRVADFVKLNINECLDLSIMQIAKGADASEATVVRFCRNLGYSGLKAFKISLAKTQTQISNPQFSHIAKNDSLIDVKEKVFWGGIRAIRDTLDLIDDAELERAVTTLAHSGNIDFCCLGAASDPVITYARHQFMKIGVRSQTHSTTYSLHYSISQFTEDCVVVAVSCSGETKQILEVVEAANSIGATTIAITNYPESSLASISDICLITTGNSFLGKDKNSLSRFAQLSILNTLYIGVALYKDKQAGGTILNERNSTSEFQ